jgi:acetyl-CoA acetyltransferase family protein
MPRTAIIDGIRTPFTKINTSQKNIKASELAKYVIQEVMERTGLNSVKIDHVVIGCGGPPADAPNIARTSALKAGIPVSVPAYTVQRNCASGIQAITEACMMIQMGHAKVVIAGGVESMSNIPFYLKKSFQNKMTDLARAKSIWTKLGIAASFRPRDFSPVIGVVLGLTDTYCGLNMGETAEVLAKRYGITRSQQDEFALRSHQRVTAAWEQGLFKDEVMTIFNPGSEPELIVEDNGHRTGQTMRALARLKPYFDRQFGTITPGNSSQLTDGAAAMVLMDEQYATAEGYTPKAYIRSWGYAGNDPSTMGLGPAFATPIALERAGLAMKDIQLIELNEAFAAQVIANEMVFSSKKFAQENLGRSAPIGEINREILNVNGGAIALGHPIGASGTRIVLTLIKEMERRNYQNGLATLCVGGGQGAAIILERS